MNVGNGGQIVLRISGDLSALNYTMKEYEAALVRAEAYSASFAASFAKNRAKANDLQLSSDQKVADAEKINTDAMLHEINQKKEALRELAVIQEDNIKNQVAAENSKQNSTEKTIRLARLQISLEKAQIALVEEGNLKSINSVVAHRQSLQDKMNDNKKYLTGLKTLREGMISGFRTDNPGMSRKGAIGYLDYDETFDAIKNHMSTTSKQNKSLGGSILATNNAENKILAQHELQVKKIEEQTALLKRQIFDVKEAIIEKKRLVTLSGEMVEANNKERINLEREIEGLTFNVEKLEKQKIKLLLQSQKEKQRAAEILETTAAREVSTNANASSSVAMAKRRLQYGQQYGYSAVNLVSNSMLMGGGAIAGALGGLAVKGAEYERTVMQVFHNTSIAVESYKTFETQIEKLAMATGAPVEKLISAFKDIENYGYSGSESVKILSASLKASISMGSPIETTATLVAQIMTAYKMTTDEASSAVSYLSKVAKMSQGDLQNLVGVFGPILVIARTHGVTLQDLGTAYITMTRNSVGAAQSINQIKTSIMKLTTPSKQTDTFIKNIDKITGRDLTDSMSASGMKKIGYLGVLNEIYETTQKLISMKHIKDAQGVIDNIMPNMRGSTAITVFVDGLKGMLKTREELKVTMKDNIDDEKKYLDVINSSATQIDKLKNSFTLLGKNVAEYFAPTILRVTEALRSFSDILSNKTTLSVVTFSAFLLVHLAVIVKIVASIYAMKKAFEGVQILSLVTTFGQFALVVAAVTAVIWLAVNAYHAYNRAKADDIADEKKNIEAKQKESVELLKLMDKYDALVKVKKKTKEQTELLQRTLDAIADKNPEYIKGYDAQGHALSLLADHYKKATAEAEKLKVAFEANRQAMLNDKKEGFLNKRDELQDRLDNFEVTKQRPGNQGTFYLPFNYNLDHSSEEYIEKKAELQRKLGPQIKALSDATIKNAKDMRFAEVAAEAIKAPVVNAKNPGHIDDEDRKHREFLDHLKERARKIREHKDHLVHEANTMTEEIKRKYAEAYAEFFGGSKLDGDYEKMLKSNPVFAGRKVVLDVLVQATDKMKALKEFSTHFSTIENRTNDLMAEDNRNIKDYIAEHEKLARLKVQEGVIGMFGFHLELTNNGEKVDKLLKKIADRIEFINKLHFDTSFANLLTEIQAPLDKAKTVFEQTMDKINKDPILSFGFSEEEKFNLAMLAQGFFNTAEKEKKAEEATKNFKEEMARLTEQSIMLNEELRDGEKLSKQLWSENIKLTKEALAGLSEEQRKEIIDLATKNGESQKALTMLQERKKVERDLLDLQTKWQDVALRRTRPDLAEQEDVLLAFKKNHQDLFTKSKSNSQTDIDILTEKVKKIGLTEYWNKTKEATEALLNATHRLRGGIVFTMETWKSLTREQQKAWEKLAAKIDIKQQVMAIMQGMQGIIENSLTNLRTKGFKNFFSDILRMFDDMLFQMAVKWLAQQAMMGLTNLVEGALSGMSGSSSSAGPGITGADWQSSHPLPIGRSAGRSVVVNMNVHTPDANSFKASRSQILADVMSSARMAGARA